MKLPIKISLSSDPTDAKIEVGDHDITDACRRVTVTQGAGGLPEVRLELLGTRVKMLADGEAEVVAKIAGSEEPDPSVEPPKYEDSTEGGPA